MAQNRIGIHAGVWGFDWSPAAADRVISSAASLGYDLIEIPAIDPGRHSAVDTRASLRRHGLESTVSLALTTADDITSADGSIVARGERRLLDAVRFAADIGARFVGGVVYSAMGRYSAPASAEGRDGSLAVLRRVAVAAAADGITLGVEYVNRYESNLLNTAGQTLDFLDELDAPNAVLHLDTFHAHVEEADITDPVTLAGDRLGYIHASESHRGPLGTGSLDWPRLTRALVTEGYRGDITVETFSSAMLTDDETADIGVWRRLWDDPDRLAAHSLDFLRRQLHEASVVPTSAPLVGSDH